jgi:hypothetical protein
LRPLIFFEKKRDIMHIKKIILLGIATLVMLTGCGEKQMAPGDEENEPQEIAKSESNE